MGFFVPVESGRVGEDSTGGEDGDLAGCLVRGREDSEDALGSGDRDTFAGELVEEVRRVRGWWGCGEREG